MTDTHHQTFAREWLGRPARSRSPTPLFAQAVEGKFESSPVTAHSTGVSARQMKATQPLTVVPLDEEKAVSDIRDDA